MSDSRITDASFSREEFREFCANAPGDIDPDHLVHRKPDDGGIISGSPRFGYDQPLFKYLTPGEAIQYHLYGNVGVTVSPEVASSETYDSSSPDWTMTSLLLTDAWLRFIIPGEHHVENDGRKAVWGDTCIDISVYSITDVTENRGFLEEKVPALNSGGNSNIELEIRERGRDTGTMRGEEEHVYRFSFVDDEMSDVASYLSDRVSMREATEDDLERGVDHLLGGERELESGDFPAAIASFNTGLEAIESAVFDHESGIGLERTTTDGAWDVDPTTPAAENWIDSLSWKLTEQLDADSTNLLEVVDRLREHRQNAATRLVDSAVDAAHTEQQADQYLQAADAYRRAEELVADYGAYLPQDSQYQFPSLRRERIEVLIDGARRLVSDGAYADAESAYEDALALSREAAKEYHSQIVHEWVQCLVCSTRTSTSDAQSVRELVVNWPATHSDVITTLGELLETHPDQAETLLWRLSQTFDGSASDSDVAYVIRELLETHRVDIDEASVTALLDSEVADNRRLACEMLALTGGEETLEAVRELQSDPDYDTRVAALRAIKTLARRTGVSLTRAEQQRTESVELIHHGEGDIVTGTQDKTTVEDSVLNRSEIDTETDDSPGTRSTDTSLRFCPECGTDLGGFDRVNFCPGCGTDLS